MNLTLNPRLAEILRPAYGPCEGFSAECRDMRWDPEHGHVPRGFRGAAGNIEEIELVLVYAEPGNPLPGEKHTGLSSAYAHSTQNLKDGTTQFHRNVKYILGRCWPALPLEEQMRRVWMTESVLCSARKEGGPVSAGVCRACGARYLLPQLRLLEHALVVALGAKARDRLRKIGATEFFEAGSVAPPGCNHASARESWDAIATAVESRRR